MTIRRVAVIFDNTARPETTGIYCRRAIGKLVEVEHFLPTELSRIKPGQFDLFLCVDDGFSYRFPRHFRPSAYWAIDTHLDFARSLTRSADFDWVFAAQKNGAEALRKAGISTATWLPLACDPEIHGRRQVPKRHDVAFVGNRIGERRQALLRLIEQRFPNSFLGNAPFTEIGLIYSAAHTGFNCGVEDDVNMRVHEVVGSGTLLLTNDLAANGQDELYRPGVHLDVYRDAEELLDKIQFYLGHEEIRERIAAAGRAEALARHTYRHRMETMLVAVEQSRVSVSVPGFPSDDEPPTPSTANVKEPTYFGHARPELLALIPTSARRMLEFGCGAGRMGEALKARQQVHVTGIELDPDAARLARGRLDAVLEGDIEEIDVDAPPGTYDVLSFADVLEHLTDPGRELARFRPLLAPDGLIVASLPNVRHHTVVASLLAGNWTYEAAGLLDRTHLRFFTRREIEKLFFRAGFDVRQLMIVPGPGHAEWQAQGCPGEVKIGRLHIGGLSPAEAEEFFVYQYLVTAAPRLIATRFQNTEPGKDAHSPNIVSGLTSIVLVTWNQWPYTQACLESIRLLTDEPYELIVVDNGSTDGTPDYLRGMPDVRVIANSENRGFPAGANQGIEAARGEQVVLLNNDCLVTTGWLARLLAPLDRDSTIGLVGPCSNEVSGEQRIPVNYDSLADLDGFAWDWGKAHQGQIQETDRLVGFCLLIRRSLIDEIGPLDTRFGIGNFEDDDFCRRARLAGHRAVIALDAFVHHFGHRTFEGNGVDLDGLLHENQRLYDEKWTPQPPPQPEQRADTARPKGKFAVEIEPGKGLKLRRSRPRISLCMIVRDNAQTIGPCLESIRDYVDEMIVVDTGSRDETPEIARRLGAKVSFFEWCDSFSAARNESIRHATGEWIFWMDSDDTMPRESAERLGELAESCPSDEILGFVMQVHCPGPGNDGGEHVTVVDHVKMFRNRPDLRFEFRIHEQIIPAIRRAGGNVQRTDIYVVHSGADHTPEGRSRKVERDLRLLDLDLAEHPDHPFVLFNLGMTHHDVGDHDRAAEALTRSIQVAEPSESQVRKAYALLVGSLTQLERLDEAWRVCADGRTLYPRDPELSFRQGILAHRLGRLADAETAYLGALANDDDPHFSSLDRGIVGHTARHNLAIVLSEMGRAEDAESAWRQALIEAPLFRDAWRGLIELLLRQGRLADADAELGRLLLDEHLRMEGLLLRSRLEQSQGRIDEARAAMQLAVQEYPDDLDVLERWCQFTFEHGLPAELEESLAMLLACDPENASAHHNLGTLHVRLSRHAEATVAYRRSLDLRPNHLPTYLQLGHALLAAGDRPGAVAALSDARRIAPTNQEINQLLREIAALPGGKPLAPPAPPMLAHS